MAIGHKDWSDIPKCEQCVKLQVENKRLKEKINVVCEGLPALDFKKLKKGMGPAMLVDLDDPEEAFLYGWASAELEYGEILSKP